MKTVLRNCQKDEDGFSLAATMALGVVSMLWVSAMAATVIPAYQQTTVSKVKGLARTAAETALDAVIADMNSNFDINSGTTTSQYNCTTPGSYKSSTVTTSTLSDLANATTTVRVYNRFPGGTATTLSSIYDTQLAAGAQPDRYYRIVEARTTIGRFEKRLRAVLEPRFENRSGNPSIVWPYAGFGDQGMTVVGRTTVDSYYPGQAADPVKDKLDSSLGSNVNTGHVGQNSYNYMTIGGNQYEFPNPVSTQTAQMQNISTQFNAQLVTQAKWCQYYGDVYSNGSSTAHYPAGPSSFDLSSNATPYQATGNHPDPTNDGWQNVRGLGNTDAGGHWTGGKVEAYQDYKKVTLVPAPTAPSSAVNLGTINLQNAAKIVFAPGGAATSGSIGTVSTGTITLAPGDYKISSVALSGTSKIEVAAGSKVNLYIEGTSGGTNVVSVSKSASLNNGTNADAKGLSIYTNSSKDIVVNGNSRSLVYAPNARVLVGSGADSNGQANSFDIPGFSGGSYGGVTNMDFWGSVTGREVYFLANPGDANSRVRMHYDRSLKPAGFNYLVKQGTAPSMQATNVNRTFTGWRAVAYQEDPAALN